MKKIVLALLFLASCTALADIQGAPFIPESDARFNAIEQGNHYRNNAFPMGSVDGHWAKQEAQATYDFSKMGGLSTVPIDLKVSIPNKAIITQAFMWTGTAPTTSTSGTLGFYCQTAGDILTQQAVAFYGSANAIHPAIQTGTAATMLNLTAKCDLTANIATGPLTAGKITLFVEYVTHQ